MRSFPLCADASGGRRADVKAIFNSMLRTLVPRFQEVAVAHNDEPLFDLEPETFVKHDGMPPAPSVAFTLE